MEQAIEFMNDKELTLSDSYLKFPTTYTNSIIPGHISIWSFLKCVSAMHNSVNIKCGAV